LWENQLCKAKINISVFNILKKRKACLWRLSSLSSAVRATRPLQCGRSAGAGSRRAGSRTRATRKQGQKPGSKGARCCDTPQRCSGPARSPKTQRAKPGSSPFAKEFSKPPFADAASQRAGCRSEEAPAPWAGQRGATVGTPRRAASGPSPPAHQPALASPPAPGSAPRSRADTEPQSPGLFQASSAPCPGAISCSLIITVETLFQQVPNPLNEMQPPKSLCAEVLPEQDPDATTKPTEGRGSPAGPASAGRSAAGVHPPSCCPRSPLPSRTPTLESSRAGGRFLHAARSTASHGYRSREQGSRAAAGGTELGKMLGPQPHGRATRPAGARGQPGSPWRRVYRSFADDFISCSLLHSRHC